MLFKLSNNRLELIHEKSKLLEKHVQDLVADNLELLFGLTFVAKEFRIDGKRIDILAWDEEVKAPVIIELKRENAEGLFDQGMEYFHLLSNRKNDFLIKLHQELKIEADPKKVDWSSSRVIFIGRKFTLRQQRAIDFKGIPIELWDYDWFENNTFKIEKVGLDKKAKLEIDGVGNDKSNSPTITREFKEYDKSWHESYSTPKTWEIFKRIESELLTLEEGEEHFKKDYIAFKRNNKNFACLELQKKQVKCWIHSNNFQTSLDIKDMSNKGHHGTGIWEITISNIEQLPELFVLLHDNYRSLNK